MVAFLVGLSRQDGRSGNIGVAHRMERRHFRINDPFPEIDDADEDIPFGTRKGDGLTA